MPIASPQNEKLKKVRRAQARRGELFAAEGEDLVRAARAAGWPADELLVVPDAGLEGTEVEPELLARVSQLGSGTRVIGLFEERWGEPQGPLCVALHGVRDPGNVGTVIRSALAFGAGSVVIGPGTASPYGPKAVRASMGALFGVRVARWGELPRPVVGLVAHQGEPLRGPLQTGTLVVGAEREGLPQDVVAACDRVAHIPIAGESLNAAMAASIALYEATRA